jgi:hypothetical protein
MDVIHFTRGATDPMKGLESRGAHFLPLADGEGGSHISCVYLDPGATVQSPSLNFAAALLVVHGRLEVNVHLTGAIIGISAGVGCVFKKDEVYSLESPGGAIFLVVEADTVTSHARGISSPPRIAGQTWPSDVLLNVKPRY